MTPEEILNYIKENHLKEMMFRAVMSNDYGYQFAPIKGKLIRKKGEYFFRMNTNAPDADMKVRKEDVSDIDEMIEHPEYTSAAVVSHEGKNFFMLSCGKNEESRREILYDHVLLDFIRFTNIDNTRKVKSMILRAEERLREIH